jgi:phosphatidylserine/phosphatidylglycerophosphate/cardiolipin synthase-like enzyme
MLYSLSAQQQNRFLREPSSVGPFNRLGGQVFPLPGRDSVRFGANADEKLVNKEIALPAAAWKKMEQSAKSAELSLTDFLKAVLSLDFDFKQGFWKNAKKVADSMDMSIGEYLRFALPQLSAEPPKKPIVDSIFDTVIGQHQGKAVTTKVTTLMGPRQIFDEWIRQLTLTKKYAQISLYNFENVGVGGGRGVDGAEVSDGWVQQQKIIKLIEAKARQKNPVHFQIILDNSVIRERDEFGNPVFPRKMTNQGMIDHLRKLQAEGLPIDFVAYPRTIAQIYHLKGLISDGVRGIVTGMNQSNHSAANWDAGVAIEGPEVANVQKHTFYPDWVFAKIWEKLGLENKDVSTTEGKHFLHEAMQETKDLAKNRMSIVDKKIVYAQQKMKHMGFTPQLLQEILSGAPTTPMVPLTPQDPAYQAYKEKPKAEDLAWIDKLRMALPAINPVDTPSIQVLNTFPREYKVIGLGAKEEIGDYMKQRFADPNLQQVHSEEFIATHKEIKEGLIRLHHEGKPVQILESPSVMDQFPYCRKTTFDLMHYNVPVRFYDELEEIGQKLHCKWTVFNDDEVAIRTANLSARAMETNAGKGLRPDYPHYPDQKYIRGNRDTAIIVKSAKIAGTFLKQFGYDWEISSPKLASGHGAMEKIANEAWYKQATDRIIEALGKLPHVASNTQTS